jgi:crotonobetainyl-CoA:carnitine CoA-transferase CaiB-like acyl-CoA transferase
MLALQSVGIAAGVVENVEDMFFDPQMEHRNHFVKLDHPNWQLFGSQPCIPDVKNTSKIEASSLLRRTHGTCVP